MNCTTEIGAINCKLFLTPRLWILCKSQFRDIYYPCLSFIGKIPRITCVHAGLLSLPSVRWAGASGTRSQWLSSFHIFLQLLLLVCAATVPSFCFSAPPFIAETGVTLFWEVTGRECCQAKSGFSPPQNPSWATSEWSHQMFSYISLPSWEEDKTSVMKTNIYKGSAQLLANLCKTDTSFRTEEPLPRKRVRPSMLDWKRALVSPHRDKVSL